MIIKIDLIFLWSLYIVIGCLIGGAIGFLLDIFSICGQKKKLQIGTMLLNYFDVVILTVFRFVSLPLIIIVIGYLDTLFPTGGDMKNFANAVNSFLNFLVKIVSIFIILLTFLKVKIPSIAKPNEVERVYTIIGTRLGLLVSTGYFIYGHLALFKKLLIKFLPFKIKI